jgi:chaperonin GroES
VGSPFQVIREETSTFTTDGEQSMNVRPLHDRIIVSRLDEGEQRVGGIIIPDSAKEKPQQGKVIAAGNGKSKDDGKRVPLDVKAGDLILFGKYSGQEIKLDGEEFLIMREDEVLAVIEDGAGESKKKK